MLKIIIVLLLLGVIASLTSGLVFLFKDTDQPDSKRTLARPWYTPSPLPGFYSAIAYGFYTGELHVGVNAPWHAAQAASE